MIAPRQVTCQSCDAVWDRRDARYCGRCGSSLTREDSTAGLRRSRPVPRPLALVAALAAIAGLTVAITTGSTAIDLASPDDGSAVELPEELGPPAELTPDQRAALEPLGPGGLRCEPEGCEASRLELTFHLQSATVAHGWLAILDGTTLRVRWLGLPESEDTDTSTRAYDVAITRLFDERPNSMERPPERLAVGPGGMVALVWPERAIVVDASGEESWRLESDAPLRYAGFEAGQLLLLREEASWTGATTDNAAAGDPSTATSHRLEDGREVWRRQGIIPLNLVEDGLLVSRGSGVELLDLADGHARWERDLAPTEQVQVSSGRWLLLADRDGTTLVDAVNGREVASAGAAALLTGFHQAGELWVAAWLDRASTGAENPEVAVTALGADGSPRWRLPLAGLDSSRCCPAAMSWFDDTVATFDPAADGGRWSLVDAATGNPRSTTGRAPRLPFDLDVAARVYATHRAPDRIIQEATDRIGVVSAGGQVRVLGDEDLEVVSLDPLVVTQGNEVLTVRRVVDSASP